MSLLCFAKCMRSNALKSQGYENDESETNQGNSDVESCDYGSDSESDAY